MSPIVDSAGETMEGLAEFAKKQELTLPIALNADGTAKDIFGARFTTTTVIIDKTGVLRYRGQFGDGKHAFVRDALRAVLNGEDVRVQETSCPFVVDPMVRAIAPSRLPH